MTIEPRAPRARVTSDIVDTLFTGNGFMTIWRHIYDDESVGIETVYRAMSEEVANKVQQCTGPGMGERSY